MSDHMDQIDSVIRQLEASIQLRSSDSVTFKRLEIVMELKGRTKGVLEMVNDCWMTPEEALARLAEIHVECEARLQALSEAVKDWNRR